MRLVLVVEDPLARQGLAALLGGEVAVDAVDALEDLPTRARSADVVVCDGADAVRQVAESDVDRPVLALVDAPEDAAEAWRWGAQGVVARGVEAAPVLAAVHAVVAGLRVVDDRYPDLLRLPDLDPPEDPLTPREDEVLLRLAEGWSNARIAADLQVSERTVKFHVRQLMAKLGATSRTDVVVRAARSGVLWL